jgi:hypothetical protein
MKITLSALALLSAIAAPAFANTSMSSKEIRTLCDNPALKSEERMNCRSQLSTLHTAKETATIVEVYQKMIDERTENAPRRG